MIRQLRQVLHDYYLPLTLVLLTVITFLSLYPLPELPTVPGKDKTLHMVAYATLSFPVSVVRPRYILIVLLVFMLWSGGLELIQPYVNRHRELADWLANTAGLSLGLVAGRLFDRLTKHKP